MKINNKKEPLNSWDKVTKGCIIECQGRTVVIDKVHSADHYEQEGWFVELTDTNGKYRYWKQYQDGGQIYPPDSLLELRELCEATGREIAYKNDLIVTFDRYEGTDAQYFETYEEAIEWEKGYLNMVEIDDSEDEDYEEVLVMQ